MSQYILDASALLAWLWQEPGGERVADLLADQSCAISSVNLSEVIVKAIDKGLPAEMVWKLLSGLDSEIAAFTQEDAQAAALLRPATRHLGLSLGDRACLALARSRQGIAVTADRPWTQADLGIDIECIRGMTS